MNIEEEVLAIIRSNTEDKCALSLGTQLRTELRLDSFGMLMVINALEEGFGIALQEEDFRRVNTVADVVLLVKEKVALSAMGNPAPTTTVTVS